MSSKIDIDIVSISERLKEEREKIGYTQASVARELGVSRESIRNIENAQSDFRISILVAAARIGMDAQYILTGKHSLNVAQAEKAVQSDVVFNGEISGVAQANAGSVVNITNTKRHITRVVAKPSPGEGHISEDQCAILHKLVTEIIQTELQLKKRPRSYQSVWSSLNAHCNVASYRMIDAEDFEKARKFLNTWLGRLNSTKTASIKTPDTWRKKRIAYIKVNSKSEEEAAAVRSYIERNFKEDSLANLSNDQLEQTYRYIAGRKNKRR